MFSLNQASGTTLLLVTHDRSIAQRCQRRFEMVAGRLRESL
jgi:putative ABC transport system ATP-binding protein